MIDDKSTNSTGQPPADTPETTDAEISKSRRKRDADAIRDLGQQLADLGPSELATVPLPEDVRSAIEQLGTIKAHGARKRQLGYLAKKLRHTDTSVISSALEKLRLAARANTLNHHRVEQWRDRLLGESSDETANDALTTFLQEFSTADRQHLRQLQRQALKERSTQRPPAAARQLFKEIRSIINNPAEG